jgi:aryl-alcohol dehydrogenase-like predicted oxidoreductase
MRYRNLGNTGVAVSEIGFGCWTMGGLNWNRGAAVGWPDVNEDEIADGVKAALDAGVNHFDNADIYGNGLAERMLARVLRRLGVDSTRLVIASKIGHFQGTAEHPYHPFHIRRQCEQSLINLGRDYLDIYYFHTAAFGDADRYLDDAVATLDDLVAEGKVRLKGQSAYSDADFLRVVPKVEPHVLQSRAHALDLGAIRPGSPVHDLMEKRGISFVAFSPLAKGILLDRFDPGRPPQFEPGDHRADRPEFTPAALRNVQPKLTRLKQRFGATTEDLARVAMQYVLAQPHVACVIPGFRNEAQARCNLAAADRPLSKEDLTFVAKTLSS